MFYSRLKNKKKKNIPLVYASPTKTDPKIKMKKKITKTARHDLDPISLASRHFQVFEAGSTKELMMLGPVLHRIGFPFRETRYPTLQRGEERQMRELVGEPLAVLLS